MILLKLLRAKSWIKNVFVFFPLIFSLRLFDLHSFYNSAIACFLFCLVSSIIYILNDIQDIESDKLHPRKCLRPLASGRIKKQYAFIAIIALLLISIPLSQVLPVKVLVPIAFYIILNLAYIFKLKHVFLIDSLVIAMNFLIRIFVGCFAIGVVASNWILVVTFFVAMMLTFIKRKSEILILDESAIKHRGVLLYYNLQLLDIYITLCAGITIISYILYTIDAKVISLLGSDKLIYSSIFIIIGVFRFIYLSNSTVYENEGDPTTLTFKDRYLQLTFSAWTIYIVSIIYLK